MLLVFGEHREHRVVEIEHRERITRAAAPVRAEDLPDALREGVEVDPCVSVLLHLGAAPFSAVFLQKTDPGTPLCISYLKLVGWFYFLSFFGNAFVGWFRGTGRMNITFWGTTIQIAVRVIGTYLLVHLMGLDAVALSTGLGWVVIALFQTIVFLLERKGVWPKPNPLL